MCAFALHLHQIKSNSRSEVGGKGLSLAALAQAGMPVPDAIVIPRSSLEIFLNREGIDGYISQQLSSRQSWDERTLNRVSAKVRGAIEKQGAPPSIASEIIAATHSLNDRRLAVRSSGIAEDSTTVSWAGQFDSYLNVPRAGVPDAVVRCWSSLFSARALAYGKRVAASNTRFSMAVVIQKMLRPSAAGVSFTVHPVTKNRRHILIEVVAGLGESLAQGLVTPDQFVVQRSPLRVLAAKIAPKKGHRGKATPILSEEHILNISALCLRAERLFGSPQDIEWGYERGKFYFTQCRPITTL